MNLLPTDEGARILPEDARPLARKVEAMTARQPYILSKLVQMALTKFAISRKAPDVGEVVSTQLEVEQNRQWWPGFQFAWRLTSDRDYWVADCEYAVAYDWGRGKHLQCVPAERN